MPDGTDGTQQQVTDDGKVQQQQQQAQGDPGQQQAPVPKTFGEWLGTQNDGVKALYEADTKGLKSALSDEREMRKTLEKDIRDLAAKADKGSELEKQLTVTADSLSEATSRADFYEAAHTAGVTNIKLAFLVTKQDEIYDKKGNPDFDALKKGYPELFGKPAEPPKANAGDGAGQEAPKGKDMNAWIREAAGRK
jgi:hypothetical protein